jgi:hypothetical protein
VLLSVMPKGELAPHSEADTAVARP